MSITISGVIRALRWQLAVMIMPPPAPDEEVELITPGQPLHCTCPDCESETLGEAAAEMGWLLMNRRVQPEFLGDSLSLGEHTLFGYLMAYATDGAELEFTQRVITEYRASVDAGDTDGKD